MNYKIGDPVWTRALSDHAVARGIPRGSESPGEIVSEYDADLNAYQVYCPNDPPPFPGSPEVWWVPVPQIRPRKEDGPLEMTERYDGNARGRKSDTPYWGSISRPVTA